MSCGAANPTAPKLGIELFPVESVVMHASGRLGPMKQARLGIQIGDRDRSAGTDDLVECAKHPVGVSHMMHCHAGHDKVVTIFRRGVLLEVEADYAHSIDATMYYPGMRTR